MYNKTKTPRRQIMDYSIQLYSVRDAVKEDMNGTLKKIAEIGYKYVEPAARFFIIATA